jgi:hypothetical protein
MIFTVFQTAKLILKILILMTPACRQAGNKKPDLHKEDRVFSKVTFTVSHRRPDVKRIQAGFLAYGSSYYSLKSHILQTFLPLPILTLRQTFD